MMSVHDIQSLPSYKKPPINEVVCGVRFRHSEKLFIPHFGCLWNKFKSEYPKIEHAPPISLRPGDILVDSATGFPIPRVWFINDLGDQLIQFQVDRFYYNWRRMKNEYPRYGHVIKNFNNVLKTIKCFFKEFNIGEFEPIEFELTYINHIPVEKDNDVTDNIPTIFKDFIWKSSDHQFLPDPKTTSWQVEYQLPDNKGKMITSLKKAIRKDNKTPLFVFEFKVLGFDESGDNDNIQEWFDTAREWIVKGFTDMTTDEIQKIWEREKDD